MLMALEVQGQWWGDGESAGAHPAPWFLRDNRKLHVAKQPWMMGCTSRQAWGSQAVSRPGVQGGGAELESRAAPWGSNVHRGPETVADLTEVEVERRLPVHGGPEQSALGEAWHSSGRTPDGRAAEPSGGSGVARKGMIWAQ